MTNYLRRTRRSALAWEKRVLGTASTFANAKLYKVFDLDLNIGNADIIEQANAFGHNIPEKSDIGGRFGNVSFGAYIRGQTASDEIPPEGVFLRAAGFKEESVGTTPAITYEYTFGDLHAYSGTPAGDVDPVAEMLVFRDQLRTSLINLVGNVTLNFTAAQLPLMRVSLRGELKDATSTTSGTDEGNLTESEEAGSAAIPVQNESATVGGESVVLKSFEFDPGNEIDGRPDFDGTFGYGIPAILKRTPMATLELEAPDLDLIDFDDLFITRSTVAVAFTHNAGGAAGQICTVGMTGYIHQEPEYFDENGKIMMRLLLSQHPSTGMFSMAWS